MTIVCYVVLPSRDTFHKLDNELKKLEGCYLCYDPDKDKWIRDGYASGLSTNFGSRIKKHQQSSLSLDQIDAQLQILHVVAVTVLSSG